MEWIFHHSMLLEPEEIFIIMDILRKYRKKNKNRKLWVHPVVESTLSKGAFYTLHEDLWSDKRKFFNYYRISSASFRELYDSLKCYFCERDTNMWWRIPAKEKLAVTGILLVAAPWQICINLTGSAYQHWVELFKSMQNDMGQVKRYVCSFPYTR
jgi:hypothetical protein